MHILCAMKKDKREKLLNKIHETLPEIIEKHDKRRKQKRDNYSTLYARSSMPPEYWEALQLKQIKGL